MLKEPDSTRETSILFNKILTNMCYLGQLIRTSLIRSNPTCALLIATMKLYPSLDKSKVISIFTFILITFVVTILLVIDLQ